MTTTKSTNRPRPHRTLEDFHGGLERNLLAYIVRAEAGELDGADTKRLLGLHDLIEVAASASVHSMRLAGFSWADVARDLGMTRQAAQQRWGGHSVSRISG